MLIEYYSQEQDKDLLFLYQMEMKKTKQDLKNFMMKRMNI